ncbi:MAG: hypothetical protein J5780_04080, partial [Treponema sp.]|nr:hypothetical protein [Treponema sp.]
MKRKIFLFIFYIFNLLFSYSEDKVIMGKEILCKLPLSEGNVFFTIDEEMAKIVGGPIVNQQGEVFCFNYQRHEIYNIVFDKKGYSFKDYVKGFDHNACGQCLYGLYVSTANGFVRCIKDYALVYISEYKTDNPHVGFEGEYSHRYYPVEKGVVFEEQRYKKESIFLGFEIENNKYKRTIPAEKLNKWLKGQKGNYEIRNNLLYRNGIRWSSEMNMCARLRSGHTVDYEYGGGESTGYFKIYRPDGTEEMTVEVPWSHTEAGCYPYRWCFGNYGELYAFIAPEWDRKSDYFAADGKEAELVAVRNYLKYFGILNDDHIRLRKGPGTDTESLGTYPVRTGFRILENSGVKQTIDGVNSEWIKVRLL